MKINKIIKSRLFGRNKNSAGHESGSDATPYIAPDEDTHNAVTVEDNNNGPESRVEIVYGAYDIHFKNLQNFMPPKQSFYDLLDDAEKSDDELIWIQSLFFKHGIITRETLSMTEAYISEESLYCFCFDSIPGYWMYDNRMRLISHFAVDADYNDKKEYVAEGLRKVIETDGLNITVKDWEKVKNCSE